MDICEICQRNYASFLCLCTVPFPRICQMCIGAHATKPSRNSHSLEPISARDILRTSEDIPKYRSRQHASRLASAALHQNRAKIEEYKDSLNAMMETVKEWVGEKLAEVGRVEGGVDGDMQECERRMGELVLTRESMADSKLSLLITGSDNTNEALISQEMSLFHCVPLNPVELRAYLDQKSVFHAIPAPYKRPPSESIDQHIKLQSKSSLTMLQSEPSGTTMEELRQKLARYEQISAKNEIRLDEKNEKIRLLEGQVAKAQAEKAAATNELQKAKEFLALIQPLLEQAKVPTPTSPKAATVQTGEVHEFVNCDGCKTSPIVGARWKCGTCENFDFCQKCYDSKPHPATHSFAKIPPQKF